MKTNEANQLLHIRLSLYLAECSRTLLKYHYRSAVTQLDYLQWVHSLTSATNMDIRQTIAIRVVPQLSTHISKQNGISRRNTLDHLPWRRSMFSITEECWHIFLMYVTTKKKTSTPKNRHKYINDVEVNSGLARKQF